MDFSGVVQRSQNEHDSRTLVDVISQSSELRNQCPEYVICDRGYRGQRKVGETQVLIPKPSGKRATAYQRRKAKKRFRKRAGIEAIISHLKSDYRMMRNFLRGSIGDSIHLMLAAAAFNFKKWMKQVSNLFLFFFMTIIMRKMEQKVTC